MKKIQSVSAILRELNLWYLFKSIALHGICRLLAVVLNCQYIGEIIYKFGLLFPAVFVAGYCISRREIKMVS